MIIHEIDDTKFEEYVKEGLVLVDFFATWCGPCKMLAPELESISKEMDINILKVDIDQHQMLAARNNVMSVPTLFLFKDGKFLGSKIGYMPKDMLMNWIETATK